MTDYEKQATDFLAKTNTTLTVVFKKHDKHFVDDKNTRDIYEVTLARGNRKFTFAYGQSVNNSGFYFTMGKQVIQLDRKLLEVKNLVQIIKQKHYGFTNNGKSDIIHKPVEPTAYDILAGLEKNEVGTFADFCDNYGYDTDSIKALKTYELVAEEYKQVAILFNDAELEELAEIS